MVEFSREGYHTASRRFNEINDPDGGLSDDEKVLWNQVQCRAGTLLVLGGGGGREVIFFGRQGFDVAAVDFSEQMLALTDDAAADRGLSVQSWVGELSEFEAPPDSFDVVWTSMFLYSVVLGRRRRQDLLRRIRHSIKPGGFLVCSFHWQPQARYRRKGLLARRVVAWLTRGNAAFENGDILFGNLEFRHAFASEDELRAEFAAGGFDVRDLTIFDDLIRGGAILQNPGAPGRPPLSDQDL
jgi:SAM-dependent methyltransferase